MIRPMVHHVSLLNGFSVVVRMQVHLAYSSSTTSIGPHSTELCVGSKNMVQYTKRSEKQKQKKRGENVFGVC